MNSLILAVATGMYAGTLPKAPAFWGSLAAFLPWLIMRNLPLPIYLAALACIFVIGFFTAGSAEKIFDQPDAAPIVIDEITGMLITLTLAPSHPAAWIVGLFFFLLYDWVKPFPAIWFHDHINGPIGIMMDDVIAGIYACATLQLLHTFV